MRIGVMIGPERGDTARKVTRMLADIAWAEAPGLPTAWIPQVPNDLDALLTVALLACAPAHRTRHRRRAAPGAAPDRAGAAGAVRPRDHRRPADPRRRAVAHWIVRDMLGLPYESPPPTPATTSRCSPPPSTPPPRPRRRRERHLHHPQPVDLARSPAAGPGRRARPGHAQDRGRARRRHRPVDGRRTRDRRPHRPHHHQGRRPGGPPGPPDRRGHPGLPVRHSQVDEARERANRILGEAEISPNYQRLLDYGDAKDIGDLCAVGDENRDRRPVPVLRRRRRHRPVRAPPPHRPHPRRP